MLILETFDTSESSRKNKGSNQQGLSFSCHYSFTSFRFLNPTSKFPFPTVFPAGWALWAKPSFPEHHAILRGPPFFHYSSPTFIRFLNPTGRLLFPHPSSLLTWVKPSFSEQPASLGRLPFSYHLSTHLHQIWDSWTIQTCRSRTIQPKILIRGLPYYWGSIHCHNIYYEKNIQKPKASRWLKSPKRTQ